MKKFRRGQGSDQIFDGNQRRPRLGCGTILRAKAKAVQLTPVGNLVIVRENREPEVLPDAVGALAGAFTAGDVMSVEPPLLKAVDVLAAFKPDHKTTLAGNQVVFASADLKHG